MVNVSKYKLAILGIKYIPFIMFIIMYVHVILLNMGIELVYASTITGCALIPSILILLISNVFKFCYIHICMTVYSLCVDICINIQKYVGFGILLCPMRGIMLIIGTLILVVLIIHMVRRIYRHD